MTPNRHPLAVHHPRGSTWVVLPLDGWECYVRLVPQAGSPIVAEVRILPTPAGRVVYGAITAVFDDQWREMVAAPDGKPAMEVAGEPPDGGLTRRALREVPLGIAVDLARGAVKSWLETPQITSVARTGFSDTDTRRPGRKVSAESNHECAQIAALYVDALRRGSREPVADAAKAWKEGEYDKTYVRDRLTVARSRGLLTRPPTKGVPGGELTQKGRDALHGRPTHRWIKTAERRGYVKGE